MNLWNVRELPIPPINTYKAQNEDIDIKYLHQVCRAVQDFFDNNKYLHTEQSILARIIYRMKTKFRSAKDFKAVEKVSNAVDIFLNMGISSNLNTFMSLIPSRYKDDTYLPSKNFLDYILVRLQGAAKLLERIVESCKISAHLLDERMHIGHFWRLAFMLFSLVSRIYILAKYTTKRVCEFYGKLLPFSNKLLNIGKKFLPDGYELPADLKEWMNVDWIDFHEEMQHLEEHTNVPDIMEFFDLIHDDSDVEFCNEYVLIEDDDVVELVNKSLKKKATSKCKYNDDLKGFGIDDIGEIIEIDNSVNELSAGQSLIVLSDNSSDLESEGTVEIDKKRNSIIVLSDESVLELPQLNKMKKIKSFKHLNITNFQSKQDNLENEVTYEKISLQKKSKNNQNQSTLKRKVNLDLGPKAKKRKLLNLNETISNNENDLEIEQKSQGAVLENLNKPKRKPNEKKNSKKKKPNNTYQMDLNVINNETGSSSKPLQKKKGKKVVQSDVAVTIQVKQNIQSKQNNLENEVTYEKISLQKKSKNNQNQLTLKRKVNLDLGSKAKKRKLLNLNETISNSENDLEIEQKSQGVVLENLNKPKRKPNEKKISKKKKSNNTHQLNLNVKNNETGSSSNQLTLKRKVNLDLVSKTKKRKLLKLHESISNNENELEIEEKSEGAVLENLNKPKRKTNRKKNSKKKKPDNNHPLNLNVKNSETGSSSKALQKKKGKKVVQSDAPVAIQIKQSVPIKMKKKRKKRTKSNKKSNNL